MGLISKAVDKLIDPLPMWAKFILAALMVFLTVYCIARYGFFSFVLHVIFGPDL